ncbi:metal-dependent transcriptional regulator [Dermabacteraceae bacterium TAE3-ERU27]|nr:metal-dependent transcriptional regulator [Dermabacteraceae bacterium TAE3-ERU27]
MANAAPVSAIFENYLKVILSLNEWGGGEVSAKVLAERLGAAPSSVSETVKKLAAAGLVVHTPYRGVSLTEEGRRIAVATVRRHRVVETFLVEYAGYGWDEVDEEAEVLEHAVSERLVNALWERLGRPLADPHGDPIPLPDGTLPGTPGAGEAVPLTTLPEGSRASVVQVSDRSSEILRYLEDLGLLPGAEVEVGAQRPFAGTQNLRVTGADEAGQWREVEVGRVAAEAVRVRPL